MTGSRVSSELRPSELLDFTADNVAPVAPEVIAALNAANHGYLAPYGRDALSGRISESLAGLMDRLPDDGETVGFAVSSGVAANALALAAMTRPGGKVYCHEHAHIRVSEHGAPEHQAGCELVPIEDDGHGRITPQALAAAIDRHGRAVDSALSLTNLTEAGTTYGAEQIAALTRAAKQHGLGVHLDGARLANAAVAIGGDAPASARGALAALTWRAGVDAVSLGLTKNGGMNADAVVCFDPRIAARFPALRDRAGQRTSKMRFMSVQVLTLIEGDAWVSRAAHANRMATRLAARLSATLPDLVPIRPVQGNQVFLRLDAERQGRLTRAGFVPYAWPRFGEGVVRLVTNWTTTPEQVNRLVDVLVGSSGES